MSKEERRPDPDTGLTNAELSLAQRQQKRENEKRDNTVTGNKKLNGPNYPAE